MTVKVTGLEEAQKELNNIIDDLPVQSELLINLIIEGISANTTPYVPIDTSNLINSEFHSTEKTESGAKGEIGFSAEYVEFVHDGPQKRWQKPGASNRFLELGVRDFIRDDLSSLIMRFQE